MKAKKRHATEGVSFVSSSVASKPQVIIEYIKDNMKNGRSVVGAQINQLAKFVNMVPELNGQVCSVPEFMFCNAARISNIHKMIRDAENKIVYGRFRL